MPAIKIQECGDDNRDGIDDVFDLRVSKTVQETYAKLHFL